MKDNLEKQIIDVKMGSVVGQFTQNKVVLKARCTREKNNYIEDIELIVIDQLGVEFTHMKVPFTCYGIQLLVEDFTGDNQDEIMIRGGDGECQKEFKVIIYAYQDNQLKPIFDDQIWQEKSRYGLSIKDEQILEIISPKLSRKYQLRLGQKYEEELKGEYATDKLEVSGIRRAYAIQSMNNTQYELLVERAIIEKDTGSSVGGIQTKIGLNQREIKILDEAVFTVGKYIEEKRGEGRTEEFIQQLPKGAKVLYADEKEEMWLIEEDLDQDGEKELVIPYIVNGIAHIAVLKKREERWKTVDWFRGKGDGVKTLRVEEINGKKHLVIGWRLAEQSIALDIFSLKNEKLDKIFINKIPFYAKIDFEDLSGDGNKEIILWIHDYREAYKIQIYQLIDRRLRQTNQYNKQYFQEVISYYKNLVTNEPEEGVYWYYLLEANTQMLKYEEALEVLQVCRGLEKPYPSQKRLGQIENWLNGKITLK